MTTTKDDGVMRSFNTGATRDTGSDKLDYEGFLSPRVLEQFARYMHMNRLQSDGKLRDPDNWQKGIPMDVYRSSEWRHHQEFWTECREAGPDRQSQIRLIAAACGMMFNIMGYIHEWLKSNPIVRFDSDEPTMEMAERRDIVAGKTSRLLLTAPEPDDEAAADECVACGFPSDSGHALECPIANDMLPCNAELWHERLKQATNVCCFSCIFCNVPSYSDPCYSCLGLEKTTGIANQYWMPQPSKDDGDTDV